MKWLKGLVVCLALIILLFAIGLVLLVVYKKEILAEVSRQLKENINAEVTIRDADITLFSEFPNFTLKLEDAAIKDVFNAKTILVNVRTYKLFFKEIEFRSIKIIEGDLSIFRTKEGVSNLDVFKKKDTLASADTTHSFRLSHEKILFSNLRFAWHDSLRMKFIRLTLADVESDIQHWDSLIACNLRGLINFEQLTFNQRRGSFMKDTPANVSLSFTYDTDSMKLHLDPSTVSLNESEFGISGIFDFSPNRNITLNITSDELLYSEGLAVIPETIATKLSQLSVIKPFKINVHLDAPMSPDRQPAVVVKFDLQENIFKSNVVTITDLSLNGVMTNHENESLPFDNKNSTVKLDNVTGKIDELPFQAHAILSDFDDLVLDIFSTHKVTLPQINREVDTTSIRFTGGDFVSNFHYKGKLNEYFDQETGTYKGQLDGKATVKKGAFTLVTRKLNFKDIDMNIHFNEDTVWIEKLGLATGKTTLNLQGIITNYVPYFTKPVNKGYVRLKVTSPNLDLGSFLVKKSSRKRSAQERMSDKKKVSDMLDKIFQNLEFDIDLAIDKLKNRNFSASKISGKIRSNKTAMLADNIKMNFGGGKLNMSLTMKDLQNDINPVDVKATASGIAVKELFRSFNNFNQKSITDKNLEGTISFDTKFKLKINDDFNVLLPSFKGDVDVVLRNGRLINVEAIHNMSNFLFRRRDFDDVRFAQINCKSKVTYRDMDISRMEIQSTVLSLFLEGKYSLDDDTNLSIQVPLSNLKKRNKDFVPQNVGIDAKVGPSIFLLAKTTPDGKTDISYAGLRIKDKGAKEKSMKDKSSKKKKPR